MQGQQQQRALSAVPQSPFEAHLPPEMARAAEAAGVRKAGAAPLTTFALAVLAGAFIALGAAFSTTVVAGTSGSWPYGVTRLLAGLTFSLGLILVAVGGAELFTGNNLIVMAWAGRKVSSGKLLGNWVIVYLGNFAGASATAALVFLSGQHMFGGGAVGKTALATAIAKVGLSFGPCRQGSTTAPPGGSPRRPLQRTGLPGVLALLQRSLDD
jgi:formate transporter